MTSLLIALIHPSFDPFAAFNCPRHVGATMLLDGHYASQLLIALRQSNLMPSE
jgi:hypothetical protein